MDDLVIVTTFLQRHDAEMAKGLLADAGIKSMVTADDCGGTDAGMSFGSAIKLSVLRADFEEAKKALNLK